MEYVGASLAERRSSAAAATVEHFTHKQAIETIRNTVGGPPSMLQMLYEYWVSKRKRKQKPLLRRLQAPTQPADNNPFNVFRYAVNPVSNGSPPLPSPDWVQTVIDG